MELDNFQVEIWTKEAEQIQSISYYDILKEYEKDNIVFAKNKEKYSLVKRLIKDKKSYE